MFQTTRANEDDAARLAEFAERVFRETFGQHHSNEDMTSYCSGAFSVGKQQSELRDPKIEVWLAIEDGAIAGYYELVYGSKHVAVADQNPVELKRLYVDQKFHGKRLAHSLMEHLLQQAQAHGQSKLWLGVWSRNDRALAFYKKWNFTQVGEHIFAIGNDKQPDLILARDIA